MVCHLSKIYSNNIICKSILNYFLVTKVFTTPITGMLTNATETDQLAPMLEVNTAPNIARIGTINPIQAPRIAALISALAASEFT